MDMENSEVLKGILSISNFVAVALTSSPSAAGRTTSFRLARKSTSPIKSVVTIYSPR